MYQQNHKIIKNALNFHEIRKFWKFWPQYQTPKLMASSNCSLSLNDDWCLF